MLNPSELMDKQIAELEIHIAYYNEAVRAYSGQLAILQDMKKSFADTPRPGAAQIAISQIAGPQALKKPEKETNITREQVTLYLKKQQNGATIPDILNHYLPGLTGDDRSRQLNNLSSRLTHLVKNKEVKKTVSKGAGKRSVVYTLIK